MDGSQQGAAVVNGAAGINGSCPQEESGSKKKKQKKGAPIKSTQPKPGACHFFLRNKGRFCTVKHREGSMYCGNHMPPDERKETKGVRIPCPLDPNHTVYEFNLQAHLKICNVKKDQNKRIANPFFREGINSVTTAKPHIITKVDITACLNHALVLYSQREAELKNEIDQIRTGPVAEAIIASIQANGESVSEQKKERR